jgi:hypothetical protein
MPLRPAAVGLWIEDISMAWALFPLRDSHAVASLFLRPIERLIGKRE